MLLQTVVLICDQNFQAKWKKAVISTKMVGFSSFIRLKGKKMESKRERRGREK